MEWQDHQRRWLLWLHLFQVNTENGKTLDQPENGIIKSKEWAIILGKALFWDMQAGSDNQACASCHFSAGADSRIRNTFSPGFLRKPAEDTSFGSIDNYDGELISGGPFGKTKSQVENGNSSPLDATYSLLEQDFPLHHIEDYKDRNSAILITTNDAVSSSGAYDSVFSKMKPKKDTENCKKPDPNVFHAGKYPGRQVEPRNTPTTINAGFNFLNFWDGRASHNFNGVDPFGKRTTNLTSGDPNKRLVVLDAYGNPVLGNLSIENASLASQAVGPPTSALEMSCNGKIFPDLGQKLLNSKIRPLQLQKIESTDSHFNLQPGLIHSSGKGLTQNYATLIQNAFEDKYWKAGNRYKISNGQLQIKKGGANPGYYTQMEMNFSMFWGLAIQMYEATLVSDQSPFDTWFALCRPIVSNPASVFANINIVPIKNPTVRCRQAGSTKVARFSASDVSDFNNDSIPDVIDTNSDGIVDFDLNNDGLRNVADIPFAAAAAANLPIIDPATLDSGFGADQILGFGLFRNEN